MLALCSCTETQQRVQKTVTTEKTGPQTHAMSIYHYQDSISGTNIRYKIDRQADSTLTAVKDEYGDRYLDNVYTLTLYRGEASFFTKRFTKADFASYMTADVQKCTILDGFRFNKRADGKCYFNVCLSEPSSDLSMPFILCVGPDGSYTIEADTTPDFEDAEDEEEGV